MRGDASGIFHVQLFCCGNWGCAWVGRPFLALGCHCAKVRRDISRGHFAGNISGSLIIGFFAAVTGPDGRIWSSPSFRQFFMIGVLGGYTTFFSFSLQTLALARDGMALRGAQRDRIICALSLRRLARRLSRGLIQSTLAFFDYGSST